jgi:outer membrane scaffolding protein for murein synthesis (MipA/OmpV family)
LLGDAEDSPVVDVRGSENQLFAGVALLYSW